MKIWNRIYLVPLIFPFFLSFDSHGEQLPADRLREGTCLVELLHEATELKENIFNYRLIIPIFNNRRNWGRIPVSFLCLVILFDYRNKKKSSHIKKICYCCFTQERAYLVKFLHETAQLEENWFFITAFFFIYVI